MRRVGSLIQQEVARIIESEFKDSTYGLITITHANVSSDLAQAKIFVVVHEKSQASSAIKFLNQEAKFLRHALANKIKLRRTPELHFYYDEVFESSNRISELLNE